MTEIIYKKESYAIIGACFEVYYPKLEYERVAKTENTRIEKDFSDVSL
jgi:hypothetical protein